MKIPFLSLPILLGPILSAQSIQVDAPRHDFGKIPNTAKATHAFKVTNAGDKELVIANVRPSCGCTSTVLGNSTLPPGGSTAVEATFTPGNAGGKVEKTIQVASNDPKSPTTILTLAAEVIRELFTDPPGATFFDVPRSGTRELTLRLKSDTGPLKVEGVDTAGTPYVNVTPRTQGEESFLDLRFDAAKAPKGETRGQGGFLVKTARGALTVPVMWTIQSAFVTTPERVNLQGVAGQAQEIPLVLARRDGKAFTLKEASSSDPLLGLELPAERQGTRLELRLRAAPAVPAGARRLTLTLRTDDPGESELQIPVGLYWTARQEMQPPGPAEMKPPVTPKRVENPKGATGEAPKADPLYGAKDSSSRRAGQRKRPETKAPQAPRKSQP